MNANDTHFQVLGITRSATLEEIRTAYIREIKRWHPDQFALNSMEHARATERCKKIKEAYRLLKEYEPSPGDYSFKSSNTTKESLNTESRQSSSIDTGRFIKVNSRMIEAVAYTSESCILVIAHRNKLYYEFYNVPRHVFLKLLVSESKGEFMVKYIWEEYDYTVKYPE